MLNTRSLVDCAMGRRPADCIIRNGQLVFVQTGEIIPHTDIAILEGHIAYVGPDASYMLGKGLGSSMLAENTWCPAYWMDTSM